MELKITVAVFPRAKRPDGIETEGEAELLEFDEESLLEMLRQCSTIPLEDQRHWDIRSITFS